MNNLIVGDLHLKDNLTYSDYVKDRRESEKRKVLNCIIDNAKDCNNVIFLGDQLNSKINSAKVLKDFVNFIEKFENKELFFLAGNHETMADGKTSLDFINEIKNKNWHVISNKIESNEVGTFCPYLTKQSLGVNTNEEGAKKIMKELSGGTFLFAHHAISDTLTSSGQNTNLFNEIVLPKKELEKRYEGIFGGHIHKPQNNGKTIIAGSVFTHEMGEIEKFIWKTDGQKVEKIKLPIRGIYKVENIDDLNNIPKNSIIKFIMKEKQSLIKLKERLEEFDAYLIVEKIPTLREIKYHENILDYSVEKLLEIYSKDRNIDIKLLLNGFELIK